MKNLNDMMVFTTVVNKGGFTAAAEDFGLPKSNISRKVTRLENELGVKLLERSTRSQHLTEIGKVYYQHCQRIMDEIQSAEQSVEGLMAAPRGILKICASIAVGQNLLSRYLATFKQQYPEVKLDIHLTNRRVDLIEEGFDMALRVGKLEDSSLIAKRLCTRNLFLYASPAYLKKRKTALVHPDDLKDHECLHMTATNRKPQWHLQSGKQTQALTIEPSLCCDDFSVLRQLAINGAGITVLPSYMCEEFIDNGQLVRVLDNWECESVDIYGLYPSHKGVAPKLRAFLDFLQQTLP
ncbi:LysR family transcriptional regulator [Photobacterium sp. OFAV2-7]|uniref:LysR family transcriptional regulator n=1 Tax=Photobacterium sp. OFAV2-7 TaxID=2917748 RepID=UPI001EF6978C|nr:LysR family transcriptional regulator [Photobacterium sp. OFAV2-7]MCG7585073.1 LysR family transcriptional regulator [Photobacterium sp. OFAV2-7]